MISSIKSLVILLGLSALSVSHDTKWVFETVSEGKVAPLLPEEYVTNFVQHKWDQDGFRVSHVSAGIVVTHILHLVISTFGLLKKFNQERSGIPSAARSSGSTVPNTTGVLTTRPFVDHA
jgi:hypothetical protein